MTLSKTKQRAKLEKTINRLSNLIVSLDPLSTKDTNIILQCKEILQRKFNQLKPKKKD